MNCDRCIDNGFDKCVCCFDWATDRFFENKKFEDSYSTASKSKLKEFEAFVDKMEAEWLEENPDYCG